MAFDPVPWAVSGSQLDAYVMRSLANIATSDTQGVQLPGNAKVTATASPSGQINIAAGGVIIRNRQAPGQSYVGHIASDTLVPIPPTSGVARSDLIVATVRDPDFAPWQPYTDPNQILFGPYFYPEVISGVAGSTTRADQAVSYSAVELARIDIPANTTTITNAMITDLRNLAQARYSTAYDIQKVPTTQTISTSDTTYKDFPTNTFQVAIPEWATHAQVITTLNGVQSNNDSDANFRVVLGSLFGPANRWELNVPGWWSNDYAPLPFQVFAEFDVRSIAGQKVILKTQGQRITGTSGGIKMETRDQVGFDIRFSERVV